MTTTSAKIFLCVSLFSCLSASSARAEGVAPAAVVRAASGSPFLVRAYFHQLEEKWQTQKARGRKSSDLNLFFQRGDDVFSHLDALKLDPRLDSPCVDKDGRQVDASHAPGVICLSAPMLAANLNPLGVESDLAGVVVRELTRQMGGDAEAATKAQYEIASVIYGASAEEVKAFYQSLVSRMHELRGEAESLRALVGQPDVPTDRYLALEEKFKTLRDDFYARTGLFPLRYKKKLDLDGQAFRLLILTYYVQGLASSGEWYRDRYLEGFGDQTEVSLADYLRRLHGKKYEEYRGVYVKKITSEEIWRSELGAWHLL